MTVALGAASISALTTTQATATLKDAAGNTLTGRAVTWSTSPTAFATINQAGVITGVAPGTATVLAASEGASGFASVIVTPVAVSTVTVTPPASTIFTGADQVFGVTLRDPQGNILTGRPITWATSSSTVATVGANGTVTPKAPGTVTISAESEGKIGFVTVAVRGWIAATFPDPLGQFPSMTMALKADPDGPGASTGGSAASLLFGCIGGSTKTFAINVTTGGPITNTGLVRWRLDQGTTFSEVWGELSGFKAFGFPSTSSGAKTRALQWTQGSTLLFEYTEFQGPTRVAQFTLVNTYVFLGPILTSC